MKFIYKQKNRGMLLMVVIGALAIAFIVFLSLVDRVRNEGQMTNRTAINERLYQAAAAIGRLSVKKLEKNFSTRVDLNGNAGNFGIELFEHPDQPLKGDLTNHLENFLNKSVIKAIQKEFKTNWGVNLGYKVEYEAKLTDDFSAPVDGFYDGGFNREKKGLLTLTVTLTYDKIKKKFIIKKDFYLVRLLASPFYRFTLYSSQGASLKDDVANAYKSSNINGDMASNGKDPLVCINCMMNEVDDTIEDVDASNPYKYTGGGANGLNPNYKPVNPVKNGWIYLGNAATQNSKNKKRLLLNTTSGFHAKYNTSDKNAYGEGFHFYYTKNSAGFIGSNFTKWLKNYGISLVPNCKDLKFMSVDFGFYEGIKEKKYKALKSYVNDDATNPSCDLFKVTLDSYNSEYDSSARSDWHSSSMHLYGMSNRCTPTLIFGDVARRYIKTYALFFCKDESNAFPYIFSWGRGINKIKSDFYNKGEGDLSEFVYHNLYPVLCSYLGITDDSGNNFLNKIYTEQFAKRFVGNLKWNRSATMPDLSILNLMPYVEDKEAYNRSLMHMACPGDDINDKSWKDALNTVASNNTEIEKYFTHINEGEPNEYIDDDYTFSNDENIHLTDISVNKIKISDDYLKDRVTYKITGPKKIKLSECDFFNEKFVVGEYKTSYKKIWLNQIIEFKCDELIIDEDLAVVKGGIIITDGIIKIDAKITNLCISDSDEAKSADSFGFITLISRKKDINITNNAGANIYAFLFTNGNVTVTKRCIIIGGVRTKDVSTLVSNGCIVQWGLKPGEVDNNADLTSRDFYGLAFGPRDIEIIEEN